MNGSKNTDFNYEHRYVDVMFAGLEYSMEIVGPDGAHFHFWLPQSVHASRRRTLLSEAKKECKGQRDLVSWSWDYIPE